MDRLVGLVNFTFFVRLCFLISETHQISGFIICILILNIIQLQTTMLKTSLIFFALFCSVFAKSFDDKLCEVQLRVLGSSNGNDDEWTNKS